MALQKAISLDTNNVQTFRDENDNFIPNSKATGYYLGSKKVPMENSSKGYSFLHILRPKGSKENVGVWGSAQLDSIFSTLSRGVYTEVTYLRHDKIGKGRTKKIFDIAFDPEDRLQGIEAVSTTPTDEVAVDTSSTGTEDTSTSSEPTAVDVDEADALLKQNS